MKGFTLIDFLLLLATIGIVGVILVLAWVDIKSPNITIKKDDWQCVNTESRISMMIIGESVIPITENVCIEYKKIDA